MRCIISALTILIDHPVDRTAPTGIAASHINGITLHSFACIPVDVYTPSVKKQAFELSKRKQAIECLANCKVLIIDGR